MTIEQTLQKDIEEAQRWLLVEKEENTYRRDLTKRIQLINWVLKEMEKPDIFICEVIENKMNELIDEIKEKYSIIEADPLDNE